MSLRATRAGCDRCGWTGESSLAARRHHEQTGHTTWAKTETLTFYGDPIEQWAEEQGATVTTHVPAESRERPS